MWSSLLWEFLPWPPVLACHVIPYSPRLPSYHEPVEESRTLDMVAKNRPGAFTLLPCGSPDSCDSVAGLTSPPVRRMGFYQGVPLLPTLLRSVLEHVPMNGIPTSPHHQKHLSTPRPRSNAWPAISTPPPHPSIPDLPLAPSPSPLSKTAR